MEKTRTRKTKLVVAFAIALCLVFMLAMGGFTYAKYASTKTMTAQTATVAKWGYVININADGLFGKTYDAAGKKISLAKSGDSVSVQAGTGRNELVAPGTTGSMTFSINGQAEVRSAITVAVTAPNAVSLTKDGTVIYEPIKWTLEKNGVAVSGVQNVDMETLVEAIEGISQSSVDPNTEYTDEYTISWVWAFDTGNADYNKYDTYLGELSNNSGLTTFQDGTSTTGYTATTEVTFGLTITVAQIQG